MLLKIVVLFLVVMMAIGMVGKLFNPGAKPPERRPRKCKTCGSFIVGKGPCATCTKKGR